MTNKIVTRFAPSPTGMLHVGGARTALFNFLFAKANNGKFLLRIEDTDKERSTDQAKDVILGGLEWLGLDHDDELVYQSQQYKRHQAIVDQLIAQGKAYKCFASKEELAKLREDSAKENKRFKYDRRWRDRDPKDAPEGIEPVVRIKAPLEGVTVFNDLVQGEITIPNDDLDDFIIQRSDGTPTYMLAVVVDDHDMEVSHVIRGDDHLANVAKQVIIYQALGWVIPEFAHIPLIYGEDGKKLSKRHGATSITEFKDMHYLPKAMRNYLLRLGFSHGDDEIISDAQAIEWFNLEAVGKSPARFDYKKLDSLNGHYFHQIPDAELINHLGALLDRDFTIEEYRRFKALISELKSRACNIEELFLSSKFLLESFNPVDEISEKANKIITENKDLILPIIEFLQKLPEFRHDNLYSDCKVFAEDKGVKMKNVAGIIRGALTASHISPSIFEVMEVLGRDEVILRLQKFI